MSPLSFLVGVVMTFTWYNYGRLIGTNICVSVDINKKNDIIQETVLKKSKKKISKPGEILIIGYNIIELFSLIPIIQCSYWNH